MVLANRKRRGRVSIQGNDAYGNWENVRLLPKRPADTVFLKHGMADAILADARRFFQNEAWYRTRGLPYRRGYLLWGPPGNGKSTLVQMLATELSLPVHLLMLTSPEMTDAGLIRAIGRTPERSLLVVEDFEKLDFDKGHLSLSGLLNAIDGPLASEGRLLIVTANNRDAIDPHFMRHGRIDRQWEIGVPTFSAVMDCLARFGVDGRFDQQTFMSHVSVEKWSMAEVQQQLLAWTEEQEAEDAKR